jgi:hypothetical protein
MKDEWCNFVNKYAVPENQVMKYYVRLTTVTGNYLLVGFCTEQGLG